MKSKFIAMLSLLVAMATTITIFLYSQRGQAGEYFTQEQITHEFTNMVVEEARQMHAWLRIAQREPVPCEGACNRDEDFARIVELQIMRCDRFDPDAQTHSPYYNAKLHGRDLGRLKSACAILRAGVTSLGQPIERPEWTSQVSQAKAVFANE